MRKKKAVSDKLMPFEKSRTLLTKKSVRKGEVDYTQTYEKTVEHYIGQYFVQRTKKMTRQNAEQLERESE